MVRVQELVVCQTHWQTQFRVVIPASKGSNEQTIYGNTADETAKKAAEFMERRT